MGSVSCKFPCRDRERERERHIQTRKGTHTLVALDWPGSGVEEGH